MSGAPPGTPWEEEGVALGKEGPKCSRDGASLWKGAACSYSLQKTGRAEDWCTGHPGTQRAVQQRGSLSLGTAQSRVADRPPSPRGGGTPQSLKAQRLPGHPFGPGALQEA